MSVHGNSDHNSDKKKGHITGHKSNPFKKSKGASHNTGDEGMGFRGKHKESLAKALKRNLFKKMMKGKKTMSEHSS